LPFKKKNKARGVCLYHKHFTHIVDFQLVLSFALWFLCFFVA